MNAQVVQALQELIDASYSLKRCPARIAAQVEDWEDELETLLEHAENLAEGLDEAGDDDRVACRLVSDVAEHDSAYLSPEQELVELWHRWNGIGEINALHAADLRADEPDFPAFVRRAVHFWIRPETTDGMIEEAARDAADAYARRHRALAARRETENNRSEDHHETLHG